MRAISPDKAPLLRVALDANPSAVFVMNRDIRVVDFNEAAARLIGGEPERILKQSSGAVLRCIHAAESPEGCGHTESCTSCLVRRAVQQALDGERTHRLKTRMTLVEADEPRDAIFLVTAAPFDYHEQRLVLLVLEDISEFSELRQIVPICAKCKKIRQDDNYWDAVEKYMNKYMDLQFTHGYCPDCARELLAEYRARNE
ncbi:MAG: PAS domain-containing protein [Kiritimatiellae bacterium]|nr:PAS domain-containing protein [Kiritimatiellia bacterium]